MIIWRSSSISNLLTFVSISKNNLVRNCSVSSASVWNRFGRLVTKIETVVVRKNSNCVLGKWWTSTNAAMEVRCHLFNGAIVLLLWIIVAGQCNVVADLDDTLISRGHLIFEDNFDRLDRNRWQHIITTKVHNNEFQYYSNRRENRFVVDFLKTFPCLFL